MVHRIFPKITWLLAGILLSLVTFPVSSLTADVSGGIVDEVVASEHESDLPDPGTTAATAAQSETDEEAVGTTENKKNNSKNHAGEEGHCAWGTACHQEQEEAKQKQKSEAASEDSSARNSGAAENNASTTGASVPGGSTHIPFVHHHPTHVAPPEGFSITARVYTDPNDKLAHFTDDDAGSRITLPYWECGATGSTTTPLPVKDAYFRHALSCSKPHVWSGAELGPHPQLVVALRCMEMTLNSGETKIFHAGDVVLLEDVVSGGHKIKSCGDHHHGHHHHHAGQEDVSYLLLTLPQHYHHVGRDRVSLKRGTMEKKNNPCPNIIPDLANKDKQQQQYKSAFVAGGRRQSDGPGSSSSSSAWDRLMNEDLSNTSNGDVVIPLKDAGVRKLLLGAVGVTVSTLMADFLAKVAPLWVAVGVGGTCFVAGGTWGIVKGGEYICTEIEMWQERKRLAHPNVVDDDDEVVDTSKEPPIQSSTNI